MGTVASNITQTVSFYNTTGVIEKEHNLYFCPRSNTLTAVKWLELFTAVVKTFSDYTNIGISQWQPDDRNLTIKGRIEDFRNASNTYPINYMVLTETVVRDNTTKTYYYGYFVVGARQNGIGAVTLDLQPDHFTNVFFLQNASTQNLANYDEAFNTMLKSTYVERQHYNRVKKVIVPVTKTSTKSATVEDVRTGEYIVDYGVFEGDNLTVTSRTISANYLVVEPLYVEEGHLYEKYLFTVSGTVDVDCSVTFTYEEDTEEIKEDNLELFANYEESFRYRRQFRDYKERFNFGEPLTETEKETINSTDNFGDLPKSLRTKIIKLSTGVIHVTLKNKDIVLGQELSASISKPDFNYLNTKFGMGLVDCMQLVCIYPDFLPEKFRTAVSWYFSSYMFIKETYQSSDHYLLSTYNDKPIYQLSKYQNYIATVFLTVDDKIINNIVLDTVQTSSQSSGEYLTIYGVSPEANQNNGLRIANLPKEDKISEALDNTLGYKKASYQTYYKGFLDSEDEVTITLITTNDYKTEFTYDLGLTVIPNVKQVFFDTLLTFSPYSFYSISYLGKIEVPLLKTNYYQNQNIKFEQMSIVSDINKLCIIPTYILNEKEIKYYSEELEITLNNQLTFYTTALDQYLIENRAQMKNQFAVNEANMEKNIVNGIFGSVGTGVKAGLLSGDAMVGLASGVISAGTNVISSVVSWAVDEKVTRMTQNAKIADLGNMPNTIKQVGTDIIEDMTIGEMGLYINHYRIDELSYNNICKYLERYGYLINLYDTLKVMSRKGWNYIKLVDFEFDTQISQEQEESVRQIFKNGVTLLHEPSYLHNDSVHNYEIILD